LILLPNTPTAGSDMLSQMVASFAASKQLGETKKLKDKVNGKKETTVN